jgi:CRISPR-associated endonuclease Csn1
MYKEEFNALWDAQGRHDPGLLSEERKKELFQTMFFQRPLKFDPAVIGHCELEPDQPRAPSYLLISQRFRLLQAVNNLKLYPPLEGERELTAEERRKLVEALERQGDHTFAAIRKLLDLKRNVAFNLERGGEKSLKGNRTSAEFFEVFGERWLSMSPQERDDAVQYVYSFEKADKLKEAAKRRWGLDEQSAEKLSEVTFEPDYMNLSRHAMGKLLPLLEQGVTYAAARHQLYPGQFRTAEALPELPPIECTADADALRKWAEHKKTAPKAGRLPDPVGAIRNPGVMRSLSELRKVVNAIIRQHGKPAEIHIELARDLRKPKWQRQEASDRMRANEKARKDADRRIRDDAGIQDPKPDDVRKVLLAKECGWECPYTGRTISMRKLVGPESEFQIEHIIPFSRSLDSSFVNLTLCHVEENKNKSNRTPYEAYSGDRDHYEQILQRVRQFKGDHALLAAKLRRFQMTPPEVETLLSDFSSRQLTDTAYASKLAKRYLSLLYGGLADEAHEQRVFASPGRATAYLRNEWKLNSILEDGPTVAGGRFPKERTDHRHHAVDAVAIALTSPATVKALSDAAQRAPFERRRQFASLEAPWDGFVDSVRNVVDSIVISHRVSKKVSGALHEETNYSPPDKPGRPPLPPRTRRVIDPRLPGKRLSKREVMHIADEQVKQRILEKLSSAGTDDPQKPFSDPENLPFLPNKKGPPIPIRKVRINISEPIFAIGKGTSTRYVTTDKNHHVEVIATIDDRGNEVDWDGRVVTRKDAYQRIKDNAPVVDKSCKQGEEYRFSLCPGETMQCDDDGGPGKFTVCKGVSQYTAGPVVISLLAVNDARKNPKLIRVVPNTLRKWHARKIVVSPLGEVQEAHD